MRYFTTIILVLAYCSLLAQTNVFTQKAIITPENIDSFIVFDKIFEKNETKPADQNKPSFEFRNGTRKILFIAGHATAHKREGNVKPADGGTGALALMLNKMLNVPVLYTTFLSESDPNFEDNNVFKDTLAKILTKIKPIFVIDLHASKSSRPYDIDFGTMNGISFLGRKDLLNKLKSNLKNEGLINQSGDFFSASENKTITKFVRKKNVPCIQLEINGNWLSADKSDLNAQRTAQLLQALFRFTNTTVN
jgi:hypothetical protein